MSLQDPEREQQWTDLVNTLTARIEALEAGIQEHIEEALGVVHAFLLDNAPPERRSAVLRIVNQAFALLAASTRRSEVSATEEVLPRTVDEARTLGEALAICEADPWHKHDMPERDCIVCHLRLLLFGSDTEPGLVERVAPHRDFVIGTDTEGFFADSLIERLQAEIGDGRGTPREDG